MTDLADLAIGEAIDAAEFTQRMHQLVPLTGEIGVITTEMRTDGSARVILPFTPSFARPGGSISGPALMAMADVAMFAGINGKLGWTPMAMTSNQNTTFLKPPKLEGLVAEATPLRFGRRLVVYTVGIFNETAPDVFVAHVTGSYALPA
jgi:uncharacterized protein (TIGR00369 family)